MSVPAVVGSTVRTGVLVGQTAFAIGKGVTGALLHKAIEIPARLLASGMDRLQPETSEPADDEALATVLDPFDLPEEVTQEIQEATPGATLDHAELPLEDFDHLTLGQLRSRIRTLDAAALVQLLDYEKTHADRLPVTLALQNRLTKLSEETLVGS